MRTRVDEILEEQKKLTEELGQIQQECSHPPLVLDKAPGCSEGYAERTQYWTNFKCRLCLKTWTVDHQ